MKTKLSLLTSLLIAATPAAWAQNAYFTLGTNWLANSNVPSAYTNFAKAVAQTPSDPGANVYYAMTRVLMLPLLPTGSSFLTHLGFGKSGRTSMTGRPGCRPIRTGALFFRRPFTGAISRRSFAMIWCRR